MRSLFVGSLLLLLLAACGSSASSGDGAERDSPCNRAFAEAAAVDDMHDTVEDLYPAVRACGSIQEWEAAAEANPGAIEVNPRLFLGNICGSLTAGLEGTDLCREVVGRCGSDSVIAATMACFEE